MHRGRGRGGNRGAFDGSRFGTGQRIKSTMAIPTLPAIGEQAAASGQQQTQPSTSKYSNSRLPSNMAGTSKAVSLNSGFENISLKDTGAIDPSNAPRGAIMEQDRRNGTHASTRYTGASKGAEPEWFISPDCVRSSYSRKYFRKGQMISLPFHVPNTNDKVKEGDPAITRTIEGPVYSKQRMAIVLFRYKTDMICLPLFSFSGRGILSRPPHLRDEYVEITNVGYGDSYIIEGEHDVIEAKMDRPLKDPGVVHISGGWRVSYQEKIGFIGELTEDSRRRLTKLYNALNDKAQEDRY
ncbi:unnamed protein product [Zymoseptoria tritici ST99CH_1A5]|uniref:DUF6590 domain-containing protein n=1 Tax=Zymoseptoria tritici ST99CH_1A5 TaxID=1276529 RepID=A0A1Y6LJT8_ZYMTR|nr:unnamed protein product [Zymoseptoria tritici ST99CH_1A5]